MKPFLAIPLSIFILYGADIRSWELRPLRPVVATLEECMIQRYNYNLLAPYGVSICVELLDEQMPPFTPSFGEITIKEFLSRFLQWLEKQGEVKK